MFDKLIGLIQEFWHLLIPFYIIDMWEKGLHLRLGKFHSIAEPGLHFKIPFFDSTWHQTIVTQSIHLHPQSITSLDYRNIVVRAIVRYDICDTFLFLTKLAHPTDVLIDTTGAMIREIIEERNWEDLVDIEDELTMEHNKSTLNGKNKSKLKNTKNKLKNLNSSGNDNKNEDVNITKETVIEIESMDHNKET